jgi:ribonuclease HI
MQLDPRALHIYTDGSCYRNPGGKSGCAAIVQYPEHLGRDDEQILDFGCSESSNNRMELLACIHALQWIRANSPWPDVSRVQIVTDSQYVKDNVFRAPSWRKNDWRNQHDEPRENRDLWKKLLSVYPKVGMTVNFEWTAGKKTPVLKNIDKAAKTSAKRGGNDVDRGYLLAAHSVGWENGKLYDITPADGESPDPHEARVFVTHDGTMEEFDVFRQSEWSSVPYHPMPLSIMDILTMSPPSEEETDPDQWS